MVNLHRFLQSAELLAAVRAALVVCSALPLVCGGTLFVILLTGGSLHQMSIFGFIISLDLLIDNASVVTDEIRHRLRTAATVTLAFRSVALAALLGGVGLLAALLGLLSALAFVFSVSFNTIPGTAGLIGVALNDSIVVLAALRADPSARAGDPAAVVRVVAGATRHGLATTLTTVGGSCR